MFNNNPYRFLGVTSNSGVKNIQKNLSKIKAYSKIEKHLTLPYELSFFNLLEINRSESLINDAENKILLDPNKIKYSLFWFIDNSSIDKIALENLNKGNFEKSENIWRKVIKDKAISKSNFSAHNNLSTLLFLKALNKNKNHKFENSKSSVSLIKEALKLKSEIIFSEQLHEFSNLITGNKNAISREGVLEFFNENILQLFNQNFSSTEISSIIKNSNNELSQSFNFSLINEPLESLRHLINDANNSVNEDHSKGIEIGKDLIKKSVSHLKLLKDILGKNDMQYQSISDKLANQIMQCGILCFNKTNNDVDYLSSYKYAKSISFKDSTIERANKCIEHCKDEAEALICCNCNKNEVDLKNKKEVEMYKVVDRNYWSNTINYRIATLPIYFCAQCNEKISKANNLVYIIAGIITFFVFGYGAVNASDAIVAVLLVCFFVFGICSWLVGLFVSAEDDAIRKQKIVKNYRKQGFTFDKPGN